MNFFGHAAVASWFADDPYFVLGSMVPDFAGMIRRRPPQTSSGPLKQGVAFHHRTDAAFHESAAFRELERSAHVDLRRRGLERGPARATAHIGVELLIDATLARDPEARSAFSEALDAGLTCQSDLVWNDAGAASDYRDLLRTLRLRASTFDSGEPALLAWRVERALAGRPRLTLGAGDAQKVAAWATLARGAVEAGLESILRDLRAALCPDAPKATPRAILR
jgi:hypothetical protein